jgi:dTDP-glucose 4,6-dehydratase
MVTNLVERKKVPVYGQGENVRDWLHVDDCCRAIELVLDRGRPGEVYNIGGNSERRNIDVARLVIRLIAGKLGTKNQEPRTDEFIELVPDRPGHDFRYALDSTKIERELGWCPAIGFDDGLRRTAAWYRDHPDWWRPLKAPLSRETAGFWTEAVHSPKTRVPCSPNQGL